jgi:hypothetical protein
MRTVKLLIALGLITLATACSVELTQTSAVPTAAPANTEPPAATHTPLPATDTPEPTAVTDAAPQADVTPTDAPTPTAALPGFDFPLGDASYLVAEILPGWESLGQSGKLTFLSLYPDGQSVLVFDIAAGELSTLFIAPPGTWVLAASTHPDRSNILLAYAPPVEEGQVQYGYSDLYLLPAGGGDPQPLLETTAEQEAFFSAFYAPDGASIFYSWFFVDTAVDYGFRYHINRLDTTTGETATIIEDAFWESVSRDGQKIVYVTFNPDGGTDELRMANTDGTGVERVLDPAVWPTVDAPFFSPDREYVYFSAVSTPPPALSWWERLLGVHIASAHNVPSDWWRIHLATGEVTRITEIFDQGMFAAFSPDGTKIAFISSTGLWVMNPDGSDLVQIIASADLYGNLEWIP